MTDIQKILKEHGETVIVKEISVTTDSYGQQTETEINYSITALPQIMSAESLEVQEGVLEVGDLVLFIDPEDSNINHVKLNNIVNYDDSDYKIVNIIKEKAVEKGKTWSHYEVHAKRIK